MDRKPESPSTRTSFFLLSPLFPYRQERERTSRAKGTRQTPKALSLSSPFLSSIAEIRKSGVLM